MRELEEMLSIPETARRLGLKPAGIRSRIYRGQLEHYKVFRTVKISSRTVDEILKSGKVPARAA
jgi:hypothetical protein